MSENKKIDILVRNYTKDVRKEYKRIKIYIVSY